MELNATIRPARAEDATAIADVLIESRRAYLPYAQRLPSVRGAADVRRWVRNDLVPGGGVRVWEEAGRIGAVLATSIADGMSWIDQLYLLPGLTGQGIGSKLVADAHARLQAPIRLHTFQ